MKVDVEIEGHGFYRIAAITRKGRAFLARVEGTQDGIAMCDDTRLTQAIAEGAVDAALRVAVNGRRYLGTIRSQSNGNPDDV